MNNAMTPNGPTDKGVDGLPAYHGPTWIDAVINWVIGPLLRYVGLPLGALLVAAVAFLALAVAIAAIPMVIGLAAVAVIVRIVKEPEWYNSGGNLTLMLLLCFPIGIYGFVKTEAVASRTKRRVAKVFLWVVVSSFSLRVLLWLTGHTQSFWQH